MKNSLPLLVLLFVSIFIKSAAITQTDSLLNLYQNSKTDTAKISLMIKIGDILSDQNPDSAFVWLNKAIVLLNEKIEGSLFFEKSTVEFLEKQKASALNIIGYSNLAKGSYPQSLIEFSQARQILIKVNDKKYLPVTLMNMGVCYKELGKLDSALIFYNEAKTLYLQNMPTGTTTTPCIISPLTI